MGERVQEPVERRGRGAARAAHPVDLRYRGLAQVAEASEVRCPALHRLGQRLTDLPVVINERVCEVTLPLGSVGAGDYVIGLSAQDGGSAVQRYIAFRVGQ